MILFVLLSLIPLIHAKELIAEVRNIPDKCGLDNTVQYWINTASAARESTLQIVGGDFKLSNLEVSGEASFGSTSFTTVAFDHLIENEHDGEDTAILSTFKKQVLFEGGIALDCPTGLCIVRAPPGQAQGGKLKLEGMDLEIDGVLVGKKISDILTRLAAIENYIGLN